VHDSRCHICLFKYPVASPLQTAEEARQFLIECRDQSRKEGWLHAAPTSTDGVGESWYLLQRQREQELRQRRREAEQLLHGFRGYYDNESFSAWSPRRKPRERASFGYALNDSLTDPSDDNTRRQSSMPRLQHNWGLDMDDDGGEDGSRYGPNPLDPNRLSFLSERQHYDGTRYPRTSQDMEVSNGVAFFSDETGHAVEHRDAGPTPYRRRYIAPEIDTRASEERLRQAGSSKATFDGGRSHKVRNFQPGMENTTHDEKREAPPREYHHHNVEQQEVEEVPVTVWRDFISGESGAKFPPEAGRYHLYASYACPGSHRALIVRALKGLEGVVSVTVVHPTWRHTNRDDPDDKHRGWIFGNPNGQPFHNTMGRGGPFPPAYPGNEPDEILNAYSVRELYEYAKDTSGKYTIPLLWDKKLNTIVNNESSDISYMLNSSFNDFAGNHTLDLYTEDDEDGLDRLNEVSQWLYPMMIHGVYRCGFAKTQNAYDLAIEELTEAFDAADELLQHQRYLTGDTLTDADIRLFVTLLRFDEVYAFYFRANTRLVMMTPSLLNFCREIYQMPGVAATCQMDQIKAHFFGSHAEWNKYSVVPRGLGFMRYLEMPHNRDELDVGHI
jgi:glutathionyl-hydroquinone reductase